LIFICSITLQKIFGKLRFQAGLYLQVLSVKKLFEVTFVDISICAITECSDHADNDSANADGIDYPDDADCENYSDDSEAPPSL
jgi:hypothetical protein